MQQYEIEKYLLHSNHPAFLRKIEQSKQILEECIKTYKPYVAFSGGKDSLCALHIAYSIDKNITAMFANSGAEFPDTIEFINQITKNWNLKLYLINPSYTLLELYEYVGAYQNKPMTMTIPAKEIKRILIDEPAQYMKKLGFNAVIMGLRFEESFARRINLFKNGPAYYCKYDGMYHCNPIAYWTVQDVWAYIVKNNLPYNKIYDKEWEGGRENIRVGAYAGSTGATIARGRWVFLKKHYPGLFNQFAAKFPGIRNYV